MGKIGIGIDYSNICKDYNTAYLDRDNTDRETKQCMKSVMAWMHTLLSDLCAHFDYGINQLNGSAREAIDVVASKRFLFYSLEKEITLQSFVIQKQSVAYESLASWQEHASQGILVQNDADGEGVYFYCETGSAEYAWLMQTLSDFTLDEVSFPC